jgi:DNA-binding NarL/FixJ family response regulator
MSNQEKLRVVLADDHRLIRAGLKALIEEFGNYQVVAEAGDGSQALDLCIQQNPEIVVLDLTMPGMNGLEATRKIVHACPKTRVIILSMHATEHYVLQALCAGATNWSKHYALFLRVNRT